MPYTFLPARGGEFSVDCCLDIDLSALSKSIPIADLSCSHGSEMGFCQNFRSGMMSEPSMEGCGEELPMSCVEASRAKTSPPQEVPIEKVFPETRADCGQRWRASFAKYHHDTHSWKTPQLSLFEDWIEFSEIWPRWGLMLDGESFPLLTLEHDTSVHDYGFSQRVGTPIRTQRARSQKFTHGPLNPYELCKQDGGFPKSEWIEELMGWPQGWSGLEPLEMDKFQQWQQWHGSI